MHWYLKGELVPEGTPGAIASVTTILDVRANPDLQAWKDRVGMDEVSKRQQESSELGNRVHKYIEAVIKRPREPFGIMPDIASYVDGFHGWVDKVSPKFLHSELYVESELHEYCGTADIICEIDGEPWVVDIKTTGRIRDSHGLQLAAYEQAYYEQTGIRSRRAVLQLTPEIKRGYRFKEFTDDDDFGVFMAHKTIFDWLQSKKPVRKVWTGGMITA